MEHDPTPDEVAGELGIAPEKVRRALEASRQTVSLETPVGAEGDSVLGDFIEDNGAAAPLESAAQHILREQIDIVLQKLPERERRIIQLRYGLQDGHYRTLEEVGREFGITRERIRQIEARVLRKLRHPHYGRGLRGYLE
jgi:RNA polymerase primary sigma factor